VSLWGAIIDHAVILLVLIRHTILPAKVHFINSVIDLIIYVFDVIDTLMCPLLLPASLALLNLGALLLPLMLGAGCHSFPLEHTTTVPTGGACFLQDIIIILVVQDVDYVTTLIDIQGVINCVLFVDSATPASFRVSLSWTNRRELINYLPIVHRGNISRGAYSEIFIVMMTNNWL